MKAMRGHILSLGKFLIVTKQAEKLKSREMVKDEGWKMKDLRFRGFAFRWTDGRTDICDNKVTFANEKKS